MEEHRRNKRFGSATKTEQKAAGVVRGRGDHALTSGNRQQPYDPSVIRQHVSPSGHIWPSSQVTPPAFATPQAEASLTLELALGCAGRFSSQGCCQGGCWRKQRLCIRSHFVPAGQQWTLSPQHTACRKQSGVQHSSSCPLSTLLVSAPATPLSACISLLYTYACVVQFVLKANVCSSF